MSIISMLPYSLLELQIFDEFQIDFFLAKM